MPGLSVGDLIVVDQRRPALIYGIDVREHAGSMARGRQVYIDIFVVLDTCVNSEGSWIRVISPEDPTVSGWTDMKRFVWHDGGARLV